MPTILADIGVPMLFIQFPIMLGALVPVILIEACFFHRELSLTWKEAVGGAAAANIISTLIGIPLAWSLMLGFEFATTITASLFPQLQHVNLNSPIWYAVGLLVYAAWLPPFEYELFWMVPVAAIVLLIPSFFASVFIERLSCVRTWKQLPRESVTKAVWQANRLS